MVAVGARRVAVFCRRVFVGVARAAQAAAFGPEPDLSERTKGFWRSAPCVISGFWLEAVWLFV
eukprot:1916645-Lingulodinium_polyedra.AAC.1